MSNDNFSSLPLSQLVGSAKEGRGWPDFIERLRAMPEKNTDVNKCQESRFSNKAALAWASLFLKGTQNEK